MGDTLLGLQYMIPVQLNGQCLCVLPGERIAPK